MALTNSEPRNRSSIHSFLCYRVRAGTYARRASPAKNTPSNGTVVKVIPHPHQVFGHSRTRNTLPGAILGSDIDKSPETNPTPRTASYSPSFMSVPILGAPCCGRPRRALPARMHALCRQATSKATFSSFYPWQRLLKVPQSFPRQGTGSCTQISIKAAMSRPIEDLEETGAALTFHIPSLRSFTVAQASSEPFSLSTLLPQPKCTSSPLSFPSSLPCPPLRLSPSTMPKPASPRFSDARPPPALPSTPPSPPT